MKEQKEIHIGSLIKEKMEERGLSVSDFAHALHYERTNIYKIFKRSSIDVDLLLRISEVLAYDFLRAENRCAKRQIRYGPNTANARLL